MPKTAPFPAPPGGAAAVEYVTATCAVVCGDSREESGTYEERPAVFTVELPLFFVRLLCPEGGLFCDPFCGSGTTGLAALAAGQPVLLIDKNDCYCRAALKRLREEGAGRG